MEMKQRTDLPVSRFSDFHIYWSCNPRQTRYLAGKFEISLRLHSPCFPSPESETIKSFHHIAIFFNFNSILSYYPNIQRYLINTSISYLIFQQQKSYYLIFHNFIYDVYRNPTPTSLPFAFPLLNPKISRVCNILLNALCIFQGVQSILQIHSK